MKRLIVYYILKLIDAALFWCKITPNKITFISYRSEKIEKDFRLLSINLEKTNKYKIKYILMKYKNNIWGNIKYFFNCIKQLYHINTSKVVILDYNNFVVSNFKKKDTKVVQIWHASGAIKRFGNHIPREYKIKNYDYVISTSNFWREIYSYAFNVNPANVIPLGIPMTDGLFSKKQLSKYREEMLEKYPEIKGKKIILYAPTFRGDPINDIKYPKVDLMYIQNKLGNNYILFYRLHPWLTDVNIESNRNIINGNKDTLNRLLSITDYLICDYSSIVFDFSILEKPMIFFTPDLEEYKKERGFYENYEDNIPGPICKTEKEVVNVILENKFSIENIKKFKNKYFDYMDGKSTKRVVTFIENLF